ncbi:hypothetical protein [Lacticaseibacillus thailandensis]|uniref:Uncharacterized protein n=1 Tax=Lacticaseibacillus thailandensis DSM 22698 = JCM 13996 TaxID=1423810 RepID=A0A0R2C6M8_9LACO|nr:hypothetical protein [Lacticaseibacillus thailandensis]KRM86960.1 hypothetical protein FD19_GL001541 [Lacticaseibacillus thailandensis DSM 22698 = JCM 13996]
MQKLGKWRRWLIGLAVVLVAAVGAGVVILNRQAPVSTHASKVFHPKQNPYAHLTASQRQVIQAADQAVKQTVRDGAQGKSKTLISHDLRGATAKVGRIKGQGKDIADIRMALTAILGVVKDPTIDNLQTMRTAVALRHDRNIAGHVRVAYEPQLLKLVASTTHKTVAVVRQSTHPLTAAQQKAKLAAAAKAQAAARARAKAAAAAQAAAAAKVAAAQASSQSSTTTRAAQSSGTQATNNTQPATNNQVATNSYSGGNTQSSGNGAANSGGQTSSNGYTSSHTQGSAPAQSSGQATASAPQQSTPSGNGLQHPSITASDSDEPEYIVTPSGTYYSDPVAGTYLRTTMDWSKTY